MSDSKQSKFGSFFDQIEETSIAICLALMTVLTFANVVARYVFNSNILWALELTLFLFAWLVLMGCSYGVHKQFHIGVDVVINAVSPAYRRILALLSITACLAFSILLLVGSWDYWYKFATVRAFLETDDIPIPDALQFLSVWLNEGEAYEKIPRLIPYLALPLGMGLLTFRFLQVAVKIIKGETDVVIASHEAEELMAELTNEQPSNNLTDSK
ncbi:MAG: TRAP transporter small permease [Gammaproteobacteria bacterium]|jgi:C4-dicarboxylate transporter, DctQ subunit|nr:TRAP transporter small permease [Gammaproteobacteria bacterium]MCP4881864.1 TRAP transporter small permease [Gammaproteobacteria bacterium]